MPLTDPRVKIYFPNFSHYHAQAFAMAARWLGLHPGDVLPLDRSQLERGLQHTSGRECLPLPICIGQLLQIHEHRQPGEIVGFYMMRGGAPCVSDCLHGLLRTLHRRAAAARSVPVQSRARRTTTSASTRPPWRSICRRRSWSADILVEIEHVLRVVGARGSVERLREEWQQFAAATRLARRSSRPHCRHSSSGWRRCRARAIR